jgi:hypothetical protein
MSLVYGRKKRERIPVKWDPEEEEAIDFIDYDVVAIFEYISAFRRGLKYIL